MRRRKRNRGSAVGKIIIMASAAVIIIAGIFGAYSLKQYKEAEHEYKQTAEKNVQVKEKPQKSDFPDLDIDIDALSQENPDFCGWIYWKAAKLNYPVVHEEEDAINKYMHTTFDGKPNFAGCLFIPYDAQPSFSDRNTFIYGHNMADGSMFGTIKQIYRKNVKLKDSYFYIYTADGNKFKYSIISMFVTDKSNLNMFEVPDTDEDYDSYVERIEEKNVLSGIRTKEAEKAVKERKNLITLSTCYGFQGTSKRLLTVGVVVKEQIGHASNQHVHAQ